MKCTLHKILITSLALILCASVVTAGKSKKKNRKVTLPNGKVLINPYVISENPSGLEVGHNNGIIQIPFKDCPKKIQKKYGYSPEKSAAYKKQQERNKKALRKKEIAAAKKKKVQNEQFRRYRRDASIDTMEIEVKKLENRIAYLTKNIPRLESDQKNLLNKTTQMATSSVSGSDNNQSNYSWYGGYSSSSRGQDRAGNRAERTKQRQISKLDDEYATNKHRLRTQTKELATKKIELLQLKQRLSKAKKHKATEAPLPKK